MADKHPGALPPDDLLERYIERVIRITDAAGGSTTRVGDCTGSQVVDGWQYPKYPGKTMIIPGSADLRAALRAFIRAHAALLAEPDSWLGTWYNTQDQQLYLDITTSRTELAEALGSAMALSRREGRMIVALFHPRRNETVYLEGEL